MQNGKGVYKLRKLTINKNTHIYWNLLTIDFSNNFFSFCKSIYNFCIHIKYFMNKFTKLYFDAFFIVLLLCCYDNTFSSKLWIRLLSSSLKGYSMNIKEIVKFCTKFNSFENNECMYSYQLCISYRFSIAASK